MPIPISFLVDVIPGVVPGGNNPVSLNGAFVTKNPLLRKPTSFSTSDAGVKYFGSASPEAEICEIYFKGFNNSVVKPGKIWFAPYNETAREAWLQSGSLVDLTLDALQKLKGILSITVDGSLYTSSDINFATATSPSNAAAMIESAFTNNVLTVKWISTSSTFTVSSKKTGTASSITFASGTLSEPLKLSEGSGGSISQGSNADTPDTAMDNLKNTTFNWVSFTTMWEPDLAGKLAFAKWVDGQSNPKNRYMYVAWDTDEKAAENGSKDNFYHKVKYELNYSGTSAIYKKISSAAFAMGASASIDFTRPNGRTNLNGRSQTRLSATVFDQQTAQNLLDNGYNFYGDFKRDDDTEVNCFLNGQISGPFEWVDSYLGQIFLNSSFRTVLFDFLLNTPSIPYTDAGYALINLACNDVRNMAKRSGIVRAGIRLSDSQKADINVQAGKDIADIIIAQGDYLQVLDPGSTKRSHRESPIITYWYSDGQSIQQIKMASIDIL